MDGQNRHCVGCRRFREAAIDSSIPPAVSVASGTWLGGELWDSIGGFSIVACAVVGIPSGGVAPPTSADSSLERCFLDVRWERYAFSVVYIFLTGLI